jgi:hypothetical protein
MADAIRKLSRLKYGRPRAEVEAEMTKSNEAVEKASHGDMSIEKSL